MTKAVAETMGICNMIRDLGVEKRGVVYADSSAALAIADRKGSGKLRHINIRMLWIQEQERKKEIETRKIKGELNPADLMTKYLPHHRSEDHMRRLGQERREGRAEAALEVKGKIKDSKPNEELRRAVEVRCERKGRERGEGARYRRNLRRGEKRRQAQEGEEPGGGDDEDSDDTHASMPKLLPVENMPYPCMSRRRTSTSAIRDESFAL